MKNRIKLIILAIIIILILGLSIYFTSHSKKLLNVFHSDIKETINILDNEVEVTYNYTGEINEKLSYGNKFTREIDIKNLSSNNVTYAIKINNLERTNDFLLYSVDIVSDGEKTNIITDEKIKDDLAYNLLLEGNGKLKVIITFKSIYESEYHINGMLKVVSNLSDKEIFVNKIKSVNKIIDEKIIEKNGITQKGYYLIKIDDNKLKGEVVVDATDIASLVYHYKLNDSNLMTLNYYESSKYNEISAFDEAAFNKVSLCSLVTKERCIDIDNLDYNETGTITDFYNDAYKVIDSINKIKITDNSVYILDVRENITPINNIRGYVLINNKEGNHELYLYLTNDIFMISGYNYTRLGKFTEFGGTIRTYNELAFNLSSSNPENVCSFSGFDNCINYS